MDVLESPSGIKTTLLSESIHNSLSISEYSNISMKKSDSDNNLINLCTSEDQTNDRHVSSKGLDQNNRNLLEKDDYNIKLRFQPFNSVKNTCNNLKFPSSLMCYLLGYLDHSQLFFHSVTPTHKERLTVRNGYTLEDVRNGVSLQGPSRDILNIVYGEIDWEDIYNSTTALKLFSEDIYHPKTVVDILSGNKGNTGNLNGIHQNVFDLCTFECYSIGSTGSLNDVSEMDKTKSIKNTLQHGDSNDNNIIKEEEMKGEIIGNIDCNTNINNDVISSVQESDLSSDIAESPTYLPLLGMTWLHCAVWGNDEIFKELAILTLYESNSTPPVYEEENTVVNINSDIPVNSVDINTASFSRSNLSNLTDFYNDSEIGVNISSFSSFTTSVSHVYSKEYTGTGNTGNTSNNSNYKEKTNLYQTNSINSDNTGHSGTRIRDTGMNTGTSVNGSLIRESDSSNLYLDIADCSLSSLIYEQYSEFDSHMADIISVLLNNCIKVLKDI